ncbi:Hepatic triacylglycerol lipase, partial [Blattella germanica]
TGQGISEPLGHFDFYPNFGYKQPGCEENVDYPKLLKVSSDSIPPGHTLPGCSHKRAFKYLKDALMFPECPFMGFKCRTKDAWLNGQCTTCGDNSVNCVPIHLLNNKFPKGEPAKYFLSTNVSSPFCRK